MRSRNVKPGLFENDELAKCAVQARYLYVGLWCYCDRAGRCKDRPARIKAAVYPYDDVDVDALLNELAEGGFIVRYEVAGERYIEVPKFSEHQHPHKNETESKIPPNSGETPVHGQTIARSAPVHGQTKARSTPDDSLIEDSLIQKDERGKRKRRAAGAASPNPNLKKAIALYHDLWKEHHDGTKPEIQPKDIRAIERVLSAAKNDLIRFRDILDAYFGDDEEFVAKTEAHSTTHLASKINKYLAKANATRRTGRTYEKAVALGFVTPSDNGTAEAVAP